MYSFMCMENLFIHHLIFTGSPEWGGMVNTIHMFAHYIFKCMRTQTSNKLLLYFLTISILSSFLEKGRFQNIHIVRSIFSHLSPPPPALSLFSSLCHLVSAPLLFVPWFHCSVLQFQHFNISSNIFSEQRAVLVNYLAHRKSGRRKPDTPTHTHMHQY